MTRFILAFVLLTVPAWADQHRLPGDVNGDGRVDFADFVVLAQNFGRTDGGSFDPDVGPVTIRDTVRVTNTVYVQPEKMLSNIRVDIPIERHRIAHELYYKAIQKFMTESIYFPFDSDIVIEPSEGPGILYHQRNDDGTFSMGLQEVKRESTGLEVLRNLNLFTHEYTHLLAQHWVTRENYKTTWFEEAIAQTFVLYTLRTLRDRLKADKAFRETWNFNGYAVGGYLNARLSQDWIERSIPGQRMSRNDFIAWYGTMEIILVQDPRNFVNINMIAHNLVDIFEKDPEAWNAIRYMAAYGPYAWEHDPNFWTYVKGWYLRTPQRWQQYVVAVADRFGIDIGGS